MARTPRPVSPDAIHNVSRTWKDIFVHRFPDDTNAAFAEYMSAIYETPVDAGAPPQDAARFVTSLILTWGAFFRPMKGGGTGRALARKVDKFRAPALSAALAAFDQARVLLGDVLSVDPRMNRVVVRDAFDGVDYDLHFAPREMESVAVSQRSMTVVVPLGDGRWYHPSIFMSHGSPSNITAMEWVRETESWLTRHGVLAQAGGRCEGEPQRWLVPVIGHAYGILLRATSATKQLPSP